MSLERATWWLVVGACARFFGNRCVAVGVCGLWGVFCHTPDEGSAGFIVVATRIVFNSYAQQQQQAWQWYIVMATRATRAAARAATNVAKRVGNKKGIASNKQTAPMQTAPRTAHRAIAKHTNDKRITVVG